jgi:hypothetical protein
MDFIPGLKESTRAGIETVSRFLLKITPGSTDLKMELKNGLTIDDRMPIGFIEKASISI